VGLVDEFSVSDDGQPDLFGVEPDSPFDELIMAGWDPEDRGDPATDPDDEETWLRGLPDDIREEYLARPPMPAALWTADGEWLPSAAAAGFAVGGFADAALPGQWLGQVLAAATAEGLGGLKDDELAGVLRGWQRQIGYGQGQLARAVIELASRRAARSSRAAEHLHDELAIELTLTRRSAARLVEISDGLDRIPDVLDELTSGTIDWPKACIFVEELAVLPDDQARALAARLLGAAPQQTTGQLRATLARAVLAADPSAAHRRRQLGRADTRVEMWHEPSGNAALSGRELAPAEAIAADAGLTADAGWLRDHGLTGTLAELRAAAFIARLSGQDLASLLAAAERSTADTGAVDVSADGSSATGDSTAAGNGTADGSIIGRVAGDGSTTGPAADGHRVDAVGASNIDTANDFADRGGDPRSGPSFGGGLRAHGTIHLTMPLAALAGLNDAPGEVAGYGPADAATCRELAARLAAVAATRWCFTITSPDGSAAAHACARAGPQAGQPVITWAAGLQDKLQFLQSGTCQHLREAPGYAWPAKLRHLIEVRQRTCSAPGCRRPAVACDIDHTRPYDQGGPTCECNGSPLCRRHHRAKQAPGWHLTQDQPGVMTWHLPSGRTYQTTGPPYAA
jgi:hypothetical protein